MSSDAIVILNADHKEIRDLFRKFQAAGDKAVKTKKRSPGRAVPAYSQAGSRKKRSRPEGAASSYSRHIRITGWFRQA